MLAWIRTSLAFVATGLGVATVRELVGDQAVLTTLAVGSCLVAICCTIAGWTRWRAVLVAMHSDRPYPSAWWPLALACAAAGLGVLALVGTATLSRT